MVLLRTAPGVSRIHASRRIFDVIKGADLQIPVIHHQWCASHPRAVSSFKSCCLSESILRGDVHRHSLVRSAREVPTRRGHELSAALEQQPEMTHL